MPQDGPTHTSTNLVPSVVEDGANELLGGILAELKKIGSQLQRYDERLIQVERKFEKEIEEPKDVTVRFVYLFVNMSAS